MIICHPHKLIIITPPHTGSRSLNRSLTGQVENTFACYGQSADGSIDHHTTQIPNGIEEYHRYVVVRHPLDRLVSLWFHLVSWNALHGDGIDSFSDFVRRVVNNEQQTLSCMYRYAISDWIKGTPIDGVIHFESIKEELNGLFGIPISLYKTESTRPTKHWKDFYSEQLLADCRNWATDDIILGGYPPF